MTASITVRGNVGTAPSNPGDAASSYTSFRIASTHTIYNRETSQWEDRNTTWYTVKCFRRLAENVFASVQKGDAVVVTGRPQLRSWENDEGERGTDLEIYAETLGHDLSRGRAVFTRNRSGHTSNDDSAHSAPQQGSVSEENTSADEASASAVTASEPAAEQNSADQHTTDPVGWDTQRDHAPAPF
ncbi:single-stranded DNA-binding protein [Nesterenkonia alba]|uniref:single-stranded DNA-binding protein n=1 Tax=Nesterenkonia alba TaxID=515814 RepID=UPI0003B65192|nr:single-stranded DNA-binding protein [Nesterenkonia alba]